MRVSEFLKKKGGWNLSLLERKRGRRRGWRQKRRSWGQDPGREGLAAPWPMRRAQPSVRGAPPLTAGGGGVEGWGHRREGVPVWGWEMPGVPVQGRGGRVSADSRRACGWARRLCQRLQGSRGADADMRVAAAWGQGGTDVHSHRPVCLRSGVHRAGSLWASPLRLQTVTPSMPAPLCPCPNVLLLHETLIRMDWVHT